MKGNVKAHVAALLLFCRNTSAFLFPLRVPHSPLHEAISHHHLHQSSLFDHNFPRIGFSDKRSITSISFTQSDSINVNNSKLIYGYKLTSILCIITSLAIFITPNRIPPTTSMSYTPTKVAGASGYAIAGALSQILSDATGRNRLESDTYKRLNIGLFLFAALGLFVVPGEASFYPNFRGSILIFLLMGLSKSLGALCSFQGWKAGVDGGLGSELWDGAKETWTGFKPETKETNIYRILFVTVFYVLLGNNIMNLYHSFQKVRQELRMVARFNLDESPFSPSETDLLYRVNQFHSSKRVYLYLQLRDSPCFQR